MTNLRWTFAPGTREGFTASPITIFQGARLRATVRETIQNSLDAGKNNNTVRVCFSLTNKSKSEVPEVFAIGEPIQKAWDEEKIFHNASAEDVTEASSFYQAAVEDVLEEDDISIFGIHDFNTSGLGGSLKEVPGVKPGQWLALVKGAGVDVKEDAASLGSFGQGSKAPYALSQLRSLFYLSEVPSANSAERLRFQGKSLLSSFWEKDDQGQDKLRIGTGYYGLGLEQEAILGDQIPNWALGERQKFGEGAGTSILLPAPYGYKKSNPGEFWNSLKVAVLTNFYFALAYKRLEVILDDGTVLNHETAEKAAEELGLFADELPESFDPDTLDKIEALKTLVFAPNKGTNESKDFGEFFWAIRTGEEAPSRKVGIARKTGMLITRKPPEFIKFPGMGNFDIFICVTGDKGSQVLRALENPAHDDFEYERISDLEKRKVAQKKYLSFTREIRAIISEFATLTGDTEETTADLNELLGGSLEDSDSKENRIEFPNRTKVTRSLKPIRRNVVEGGDQNGDSGAGGDDGSGGGDSTGGSGSSSGTGRGNKGSSQKAVSGLLFIPTSKSESKYRIYFDSKKTGSNSLVLFKSGDLGREEIAVQIGKDTVSRIPSARWIKAASGKERYFIEVSIKDFDGAIEAGVDNGL